MVLFANPARRYTISVLVCWERAVRYQMDTFQLIIGILGGGGIALVAAVLLFVVARRAMKLMIRLVIFGVIMIALLIGGVAYWFTAGSTPAKSGPANRPANSRPRQPD